MGELECEQLAARVVDAELRSQFEQRTRKFLAYAQPDEIRVPLQHSPPASDRNVEGSTETLQRNAEHDIDECRRIADADRAIAKRVTSKWPCRPRQQRRDTEDLARADEADQHAFVAIEERELRDSRQQNIYMRRRLALVKNSL